MHLRLVPRQAPPGAEGALIEALECCAKWHKSQRSFQAVCVSNRPFSSPLSGPPATAHGLVPLVQGRILPHHRKLMFLPFGSCGFAKIKEKRNGTSKAPAKQAP